MNAMLASGGYPWTVIRVEDRDVYLAALESASIGRDIGPFAQFVADGPGCGVTGAGRVSAHTALPFQVSGSINRASPTARSPV